MPIEEIWLIQTIASRTSEATSRKLAVDVGANRGSWTWDLAMGFEKVIAVEPDRRCYLQLETESRHRVNVTVVPAAVSDSSGTATFYIRPSPDQNSLLEQHPIGGESCVDVPHVATEEVKTVTLDELCPEGADFVKIDVEGAEDLVLKGCSSDGRWERTVFVVECHDKKAEVEAELTRLGKTPTWIPHPYVAHPGHCWAIT